MEHPSKIQLIAFNRGELEETQLSLVSTHLESCKDCCGQIQILFDQDRLQSWFRQLAKPSSGNGQKESQPDSLAISSNETSTEKSQPKIPGYQVEGFLGRGGMGIVYRAVDLKLKRTVALKMMASGFADMEKQKRFRIEAEAAARLHHPSIVQIYEIGECQGYQYFALEFVEGGTLSQKIADHPLEIKNIARLLEVVARAIQIAHSRNIVHRDLKPANILLGADGTPKITDFGLARQMDSDTGETRAGDLMGTPAYMSPEQASGKSHEAGPSTDIYAIGAILYECLTGSPPFKGKSVMETLDQVRTKTPLPPSREKKGIPLDLETICLKCLQKEPENRYASGAELADDLARFTRGEPILARPIGSLERSAKWIKRNPFVVASLSFFLLVLVSGIVVSTYFAIEASSQAENANQKTKEAVATTRKIVERSYLSDVNLLQRTWDERFWKVRSLNSLLKDLRPENTGNIDLRNMEWYYWDQITKIGMTLSGHSQGVASIALSPEGDTIFSGDGGGQIKQWDTKSGKPGFSLETNKRYILGNIIPEIIDLIFSPDGSLFASISPDGMLKVWDRWTVKEIISVQMSGSARIKFHPNGKGIFVFAENGTIKLLDIKSGKWSRSLPERKGDIQCAAVSSDGKWIATGGNGKIIKLLDLETGEEIRDFQGHTDKVSSLVFSHDNQRIVSGSWDQSVKTWDIKTAKVIGSLHSHGAKVHCVGISQDGKRVASGGDDGFLRIWDGVSTKESHSINGHPDSITCLAISPDGGTIVTGCHDHIVRVIRPEDYHFSPLFQGHQSHINAVTTHPDGKHIATASGTYHGRTSSYSKGELKVWDLSGNATDLRLQSSGFTSLVYNDDGSILASGSGVWDEKTERYTSGEIRLWSGNQQVGQLFGHSSTVTCLSFSKDGKFLASCALDGSVLIWDVVRQQTLLELTSHKQNGAAAIEFSPDGNTVASGGFDNCILFHDVHTGQLKDRLDLDFPVTGLAFSPDGKRIAVAAGGLKVPVYDIQTKAQIISLMGHTSNVIKVIFHPDGKRIATCGARGDMSVRVWDAATGQEVLKIREHTDLIRAIAFSRDGYKIISGGWDKTVRLWDTTPLEP